MRGGPIAAVAGALLILGSAQGHAVPAPTAPRAAAARCDYQHASYSIRRLPYTGVADFSPDGSKLVYAEGKSQLKILDLHSFAVIRTISLSRAGLVPFAVFWAETGKLFFIDQVERRKSQTYPTAPDPLWVMHEDGTGLQKLEYPSDVPTGPPGRYWAWPRLSPDGRTFVAARIEPGKWDIHAFDVRYERDGVKLANHRVAASSSAFFEVKGFSEDSKRMVVASSKGSGPGDKGLNSDVFAYDLNGKELRRYTSSPAWDEDASALDADGSADDAVTFISDRATPNPFHVYYVVPVPNNADWGAVALAVIPLNVWTSHELWIMGPEGERSWLRRLTFDYDTGSWVARNPHWSPDRRRILFLQQADQGRGGYDRTDPAGWRAMLLTFDCPAAAPAGARGRIRLSVKPRRVRVGRRRRFAFRATTIASGRRVPVPKATVRFAGGRSRTDSKGRVRITATLAHRRTYTARASKKGMRSGKASVRAVRGRAGQRRSPRFTG